MSLKPVIKRIKSALLLEDMSIIFCCRCSIAITWISNITLLEDDKLWSCPKPALEPRTRRRMSNQAFYLADPTALNSMSSGIRIGARTFNTMLETQVLSLLYTIYTNETFDCKTRRKSSVNHMPRRDNIKRVIARV